MSDREKLPDDGERSGPEALSSDPDETGFDAELRELAVRVVKEDAPHIENREWHEDSIFRAMQVSAVIHGVAQAQEAIMAACEQAGRLKAKMIAATRGSTS